MRAYLSTPPSAAKRPPARPVPGLRRDTGGLRQPPICPVAPKISHPISPNLTQSLAISRVSLVHLYVPFTFQSIGQRDNPYRLPAAENPTAIRPVPMHENRDLRRRRRRKSSPSHKLHESQFKQMSTISHTCAHTCQPLHPRKKASSPTRTRPPRPRARPSPTARSAVMRPKILAQSHTISRKLSSNAPASPRSVDISKHWTKRRLLQAAAARIPLRFARCPCTKTAICAAAVNHPHHINHVNHSFKQMSTSPHTCQPLHPPQKGHQRGPCASRPSAVIRPKFLAQSHTISRNSRLTLLHLYVPLTISKNRTKRQLLQAACGKNPTAIRPVLLHEARDLCRRRRRRR